MNEMIKLERKKILSRKAAGYLFIMCPVMTFIYFFFFQFGYSSVYYNYDTGKMEAASGFAAIAQRKETASQFAGELTENTINRMRRKIAEAEAVTDEQDENSMFSALYPYRDQSAILAHLTNPDGTLKSPSEGYPDSPSVILGYCDGWDKIFSGMGNVLSILICLFTVITISPVFAEEYSYHTDAVIYSTRYGRTRLAAAKVIASLETVTGAYIILLLLHFILYGVTYGLQGWNVNIQSSLHYAASTYNFTFLQMFLYSAALNILGIASLTLTTLFLSAKMNTPVSALIASSVICFLPVMFNFTDSLPLLQKILEICPVYLLHINGVFAAVKTYMGISQPAVMVIINSCAVLLFYVLTKRTAESHQVMG